MSDLLGYKQNLDERWDHHYGVAAMDRQLSTEAALKSAGLSDEGTGSGAESSTQSAQAKPEAKPETKPEGGSDSHIPNALEGLAWVGETLSAPIRMMIAKHVTGKDPVGTGKNGEYSGEDFSKALGLKGEGTPLWKNALGVGAEILTDPTSALPIGGKVTQKAATAVKDAMSKVGEVSNVVDNLGMVAQKGDSASVSVANPDPTLDLFKANPAMVHQGSQEIPVNKLTMEHTLDEKGTTSALKYEEKYKSGAKVPDLVVREKDGQYFVMSGNARTAGAGRAGKETLRADVFKDAPSAVEDAIKADPTMTKAKQQALRESVGIPTSALAKHAQATFLRSSGRDVAIVDKAEASTFGYTMDDSPLSMKKYQYVQDVIADESAKASVPVRDYQKIFSASADLIEKYNLTPQLRKLFSDPSAAPILTRAEHSAKVMGSDEAGFAKIAATLLLSRVAIGAGVGGFVGATHADNKGEGALIGALAGAGVMLSPEGAIYAKKAFDKLTPEGPLLKAKVTPPPPAWSPEYRKEKFAEALKTLAAKEKADLKRPLTQVDQEAAALLNYQDVSLDTLKALKPNAVMTDAEVRATQMVLKESADHLRDMAIKMNPEDPAQMQEFLKHLYQHGDADFGRNYAESGLGRALGVIDANKSTQKYLDQMTGIVKDAMGGVNSRRIVELTRETVSNDHLMKFANSMQKPNFKDMFVEHWVNGLLSGPSTYALNSGGSALFHGLNMFEKGMSSLYGNASAPRESLAMLEGTLAGATNAFRLAYNSFKTNGMASLKGEGTEFYTPAITAANVKNLPGVKALVNLAKPEKADVGTYGPVASTADYLGHAIEHLTNAVGTATRAPRLIMLAQDEFTRGIASSSEIYRHATLNAMSDVEKANVTGDAARSLYTERKKYWIDNPSASAVRGGKDYGAYITFMKELGPAGKALQELTNSSIIAKTALPVLGAPLNVAKAGFLERTPLGLFSKTFQEEIKAGGERKQMAMTRMSVGSTTLALATTWAVNGYITEPAPDSTQLKKDFRDSGRLPFALNVTAIKNGGPTKPGDASPQPGDQLIDFNKLDPALMPAVAFGVLLTKYGAEMSQEDYAGTAAELSIALGEKASDKSFLVGVSRFTSVLADPHIHLESFLKSYIPTVAVPASSLLNAVTREIDPVRRDPQDMVEAVMARLPLLSKKVIPDRNRYGEEVHYTPGLGPDIASTIYATTVQDNKVLEALKTDEVHLTRMPSTIGSLVLPTQLYDELRVIFGQEATDTQGRTLAEAERAILKEASDDKHTTGPKSWRAAQFMKLDHELRQKARMILLRRHPEFAQAALDDDRARLQKLDSNAESSLLEHMTYADTEGVDVKRGKSKSQNIPFKVR